jgi:hypothetical protein
VRHALEDGDALADEAIEQEQEGKRLLQRLAVGKPGEAEYHEALQEFVESGREHIAFEQDVVWPRFEAAVSREHLERLGEQLERAKKIAPTRPHPNTPPNPMVLRTMGVGVALVDHVRDSFTGRDAFYPPEPQVS